MEEWKLKEICELIVDCPHSTAKNEGYGYPLIRTPNVGKGRLLLQGVHRVNDEVYNARNERAVPSEGDIILAREAPVGNAAIIMPGQKVCLGQRVVLIRANKSMVNPMFLVYYLLSDEIQHRLKNNANGAVVAHLNMEEIRNLKVSIPDIKIQNSVAGILSSLDDKIECNRRINDNLQQQAQALYKSWFIDFEPFKGDKFEDSELGMIPRGWSVKQLGEITTQVNEKVKERIDVKVLSPITTGELVLSEEYFTKQVFSESISKYIVVKPTYFAYNPARVNIGSLGMNEYGFDGCVSPVYVVFRCEDDYQYFFDLFRRTETFKEEVKARAIGGVRQSLTYKDFSLIKVVYPPIDVIHNFNQVYSRILAKTKHNNVETTRLASIRDTLLPKLMSGELKIS